MVKNNFSFRFKEENFSEKGKSEKRRAQLSLIIGKKLTKISKYNFDPERVGKTNCENLIGGLSIPLGIAGPLLIKGNYAKENFYIPLATYEGALVASINRGCKAITLSGGAEVTAKENGITRAPVFKICPKSFQNKKKYQLSKNNLSLWLRVNFPEIARQAESTSSHLKLLKIEPFFNQDAIFLRFSYDSGLAMGMNMATIGTAKAGEYIEKISNLKLIALSGNVCCDKKASLLNQQLGRGKNITAKIWLPEKVIEETLKTKANDFYEVYRLKIELGSETAKTIGKNAQIANTTAAIFLACGQDIAHITETATGNTSCRIIGKGIEITVTFNDMPIGVIGGGTSLSGQNECLHILDCWGEKETDSLKFAEIIGATVLAGEISLLAALSSNDLAKAHEKLGRIRKTKSLK